MQGVMDISVAPARPSTEEEIRQATSANPKVFLGLYTGGLLLCEDWTELDEMECFSAGDLESYLDLLEGQDG